MQVRLWVPALALGLVVFPGVGRTALTQDSFQLRNTGDLVDVCSAAPSDPLYTAAANFCHGFAVGVFRVLNEQDMARAPGKRLFCMSDPAPTRDESVASFTQWAKANPPQLEQPPADSIALFLSQHFPCQSGMKSKGAAR